MGKSLVVKVGMMSPSWEGNEATDREFGDNILAAYISELGFLSVGSTVVLQLHSSEGKNII